MSKNRLLVSSLVVAVFLTTFAVGMVLATPQPAAACVAHPSCPGFGCVVEEWRCDCGLSGNRWRQVYKCLDGGQVISSTCTQYAC